MTTSRIAVFACAAFAIACGGSSGGGGTTTCPNIAGVYTGAEAFSVNTCTSTGPISPAATLTFVQASGSCDFTMTSSLLPGVTYPGTIDAARNTMTWTSTPKPYAQSSGWVTLGTVAFTITPAVAPATPTLNGSFEWSWASTQTGAAHCHGTTTFTNYAQ
jgi:hypothetical protein